MNVPLVENIGGSRDYDIAVHEARKALIDSQHIASYDELVDLYLALIEAIDTRFSWHGDFEDLITSQALEQDVCDLTPRDHPDRPKRLHDLAASHFFIFNHRPSTEQTHLFKAIELERAAIEIAGVDHGSLPLYKDSLSASLLAQAQLEPETPFKNIDASIQLSTEAIYVASEVDEENPQLSVFRLHKSNAHMQRYHYTHEKKSIDAAIEAGQAAVVGPYPSPHIGLSIRSNLGVKLVKRFHRFGDHIDLENALTHFWIVVRETEEDHPSLPGRQLNLALGLLAQYDMRGDRVDLDCAIEYLGGIASDPNGDRHIICAKACLALSSALLSRYDGTRIVEDAQQAVFIAQAAAKLSDDDDDDDVGIARQSNVVSALLSLYEARKETKDLENALQMARMIVSHPMSIHAERPSHLANLSLCYAYHYQISLNSEDLEKSINFGRQAVVLCPLDYPERAKWVGNLCRVLFTFYDSCGEARYSNEAHALSRSLLDSPYTVPSVRLEVMLEWANSAYAHSHYHEALTAYTEVFRILPQVVWIGLNIKTRQEMLTKALAGQFGRNATACAITCGDLDLALQFFEQSRSVLWNQMHQLRSNLTLLRGTRPDIADKLSAVADVLQKASLRGYLPPVDAFMEAPAPSLNTTTSYQRAAAEEWLALVSEVRRLDGFESFLQPPSTDTLRQAAQHGNIVLVNCSEYRCDALLLTTNNNDTGVIELPLLFSQAKALAEQMQDAFSEANHKRHWKKGKAQLNPHRSADTVLAGVLDELWVGLVKPVINYLEQRNSIVARLYWCLNGPLALLPVHAVSMQYVSQQAVQDSTLAAHVIPSYIPSVTFLVEAWSKCTRSVQLLAIAVPAAPGYRRIPYTMDEIRVIKEKVKCSLLALEDIQATVEATEKSLGGASWVHFACHGIQTNLPVDVFDSRLVLNDGVLPLSRIQEMNLHDADFVYLSACETGMGDNTLTEESVHIAGGMLFAGFRSAVASLWPIDDADGPQVASDFYSQLFGTRTMTAGVDGPLVEKTAEALQKAVYNLRSSNAPLSRWVPFAHFGI